MRRISTLIRPNILLILLLAGCAGPKRLPPVVTEPEVVEVSIASIFIYREP